MKDLDPERGEICIRRGKGAKDRVTVLPSLLRSAMVSQVDAVRQLHNRDCSAGATAGWVMLPGALDRKYPQAGRSLQWQWVFPREDGTWIVRRVVSTVTICTSRRCSGR